MAHPIHGQLDALVALIVNATKIVQIEFERSSRPFVPSLDDLEPHPLDTEITSTTLRKAIQVIEGACTQLCATVARPNHTILNKLMVIYEPASLQVVVVFKIPDILLDKPAGMHVSELAKKSGVEEGKLSRILRLLATKHFFREVEKDVFANNRLSMQLISTNPMCNFAHHMGDENIKSTSMLAETLSDPEWGHSYEPEHTSFNKWSKYPGDLFDWYDRGTSDGVRRGTRFGLAMMGWNQATETNAVLKGFPWGDLRPGASVCDVGGGIGHITVQLAKTYPALQLKLQDSPERIQQARDDYWPKECPEAIQEGRIEFKAMDFFVESPISDCDVYFLKNVIHNWPDHIATKILTGVRKAMAPHSRLLIQEYVLHHVNRTPDGHAIGTVAPVPLLSNYGVGRIRQYNIDIDMMVMLNSKQRTVEEFNEIAQASGLLFARLWDLGEIGVVEYGPA